MSTAIHELVHSLVLDKARETLESQLRQAQQDDDLDLVASLTAVLYAPPIDPTPDDNTMVYYRDNGSKIQARAIRTSDAQEAQRLLAFAQAEACVNWHPIDTLEQVAAQVYAETLLLINAADPKRWTRDTCLDADLRNLIRSIFITREHPDGSLITDEEHNDWKVFLWLEYQEIRQWDWNFQDLPPSEEDILRPETPEAYDGTPSLGALDVLRQRDCPKCFGNGHGRDHQLWRPDLTHATAPQQTLGGPTLSPCLACEGTGKAEFGKCWICAGTGQAEDPCEHCKGSGFDPDRDITDAMKQPAAKTVSRLTRQVRKPGTLEVQLPAGIVTVPTPKNGKETRQCPGCRAPMWDNSTLNATRASQGKRPIPAWTCCACSTVQWPNGQLTVNLAPRLGLIPR